MNSYHNQCRRGPGRVDCQMPEVPREKECCRMPEVPREKECCRMPEVPREKECCRMPEMPGEKECCRMPEVSRRKEDWHMYENSRWPIGMTYVPMQEWKKVYQPDEGFHKGTIFAELDLPFLGRRMC